MGLRADRADRLISAALDGLALRQRVISENIANVSTPGYKAAKVTFEDALRAAARRRDPSDRTSNSEAMDPTARSADLSPRIFRPTGSTRRLDGNTVDIDQEMVELAETNIRFNALAQLATARFRALHTIVTDGRR